MASSFASQLRTIAQNSTHELDLRARRTAHAESLLFPKDVAAKQDFDAIYAICVEGFRELCSLDSNFTEFERNLFSAQSVRMEREQMNKGENESLDKVLERCLAMLGGKILLKPGVRALEWLVRRFRVHAYNTTALLLAVLPWHEMNIWRNVLSVIPKEKCVGEWKFIGPYKEEALNLPRSVLVFAMSNNDEFFTLMNRCGVEFAREGILHTGFLKVWAGLLIESVITRLDAARSGRKEIQRQQTEDLILKVLPMLSDGFEVRDFPDLTTACFTLAMVLAGKADLNDHVLDSLLQAVALAAQYPDIETKTAVITMTVIVEQKQSKSLPKAALEIFITLPNLEAVLTDLRDGYPITTLIESLANGALLGIKHKNLSSRLLFVEKVLRLSNNVSEPATVSAVKAVLNHITQLKPDNNKQLSTRRGLIDVIQRLNEEGIISLAITEASRQLQQTPTQLEALLGSTLATIEPAPRIDDEAMEIDVTNTPIHNLDEILNKIPIQGIDNISFLAEYDQVLYDTLTECFSVCSKSSSGIQRFTRLPIWHSSQSPQIFWASFLLRVAVGPFGSALKTTALRLLGQTITETEKTDAQVLLPYVLTALSDHAQSVRKAAADLLILIERAMPANDDPDSSVASSKFYANPDATDVKQIASGHVKTIISQAFLPVLEECVLDATQIGIAVQSALNGIEATQHVPSNSSQVELKKSFRHDLFDLITSHAIASPLWIVKLSTIKFLDGVSKVGSTAKSKALDPALRVWSSYDEAEATHAAEIERLQLSEIDTIVTGIISSQDKDAIGHLFAILDDRKTASRTDFIMALFNRVQMIWKDIKHDVQVSNAQKLFEYAFQDDQVLASGAQGVLRSIYLTTDILGMLLEQSTGVILQLQGEEQQPRKKRRTSHGRDSLPPDLMRVAKAASARLTFMLELVDDSSPESRPELLPVFFDILSTLKHLKQQQRMGLPYLHNLCLSNILAIVDAQRPLSKPTIDTSSIRADLVIDCIRASDNTQVQTTALLLAASLASIAPDRMLHNVMPIFTFMGQNMFSKEDEHSIHVVNQAIDKIIPALLDRLRSENKDLVRSTSSLLASFVAAFDHIPIHRRVSTYGRLLTRMGAQDFAYVVFAMLAKRKANHSSFNAFFQELVAELDAVTLLSTVKNSLVLANEVLSKDQSLDEMFSIAENATSSERQNLSKIVLKVVIQILHSQTLKHQVKRLSKLDAEVADSVRDGIDTCFRLILTTIQDGRKDGTNIVEEAKKCLDALLGLPALEELFKILPQALTNTEIEPDLKPQALRVLASQLQSNPAKDHKTKDAAIKLLNDLSETLEGEPDMAMKQAIIVCIDRLTEVYGRKDIESCLAAANVVASDHCLGSDDARLQLMSLLCLASMLEVLKEACIPIVPDMITKIIQILRYTIEQDAGSEELHCAAFALFAATVSHVSFLVSDESLQAILILSSLSAVKFSSPTAVDSRNEMLSIVASKVDLSSLLQALLGEDLSISREHPQDAEIEKLKLLSDALELATKANVVKNADTISQLLLAHLDQRGLLLAPGDTLTDESLKAVEKIESNISTMSIQFVYKLNDTAFRPVFETWIDWATNAHDIEDETTRQAMKPHRQTSIFKLLTHFFNTLKSIVTSYASYIIPLSSEHLKDFALVGVSKKSSQVSVNVDLFVALLQMLQSTFTHDVDSFYNTPSHFDPIAAPLVSQLNLASIKANRNIIYSHVIPTIISLASATIDTPSHHQTLSHGLVQLRHSPSAAVRLASIKTFAAITADEQVGEEFIANVIGIGGGEGEGARGIGGGGSVGEIMIYVNEMLEDDDEDVEREVRKWVQAVREKTGEDVFEM